MALVARPTKTWTWLHAASLVLVLIVLVVANRGQWFFGDEWDFILRRGLHHAQYGLLRPHNEHWSTLPILWWRATYSVYHLHTYWPYLFGLFATHLVVVHAAWRLMRRSQVGAPLATGVALVLGLFGAGSENLSWAFQVGFVGSLAAGLLLLLLVDDTGERRRVALVATGAVASLMLSGISVVMVVAVGLAALARWGWRKAAAMTAPAAAVYLVWLKFCGRVGLEGGTSALHGGPGDIPRYVWGGMAATLGAPFKSQHIGDALLVALLVVVVVRGADWWRRAPLVLALAAASPIMLAVISQGRGAVQSPAAPRYLYLCAAMLLPLIAFAAQQVVRDDTPRVALALVACALLTGLGTNELFDSLHFDRNVELTLRGQMLAALSLGGEHLVSQFPEFSYARDVSIADLRRLQRRGDLPAFTPNVANLAWARLGTEVAPGAPTDAVGSAAAALTTPRRAKVQPRGDCFVVDPHGFPVMITRVPSIADAVISVTTRAATGVDAFVPYAGGGRAGPRSFAGSGAAPVVVHDSVAGPLLLQWNGTATVCGVTWQK